MYSEAFLLTTTRYFSSGTSSVVKSWLICGFQNGSSVDVISKLLPNDCVMFLLRIKKKVPSQPKLRWVLCCRLAPKLTWIDYGCLPILRQNIEFHSIAADRVKEKRAFFLGQFINLKTNAWHGLCVVFPAPLMSEVSSSHHSGHSCVAQDCCIPVTQAGHHLQDVRTIVRFMIFIYMVKNDEFVHFCSFGCMVSNLRAFPLAHFRGGWRVHREPYLHIPHILIIQTDMRRCVLRNIRSRYLLTCCGGRQWTKPKLWHAL